MQISFLREDSTAVITVSVPGDPRSPYIARDDHPNFKAMIGAAASGDTADITSLFDVAEAIAVRFKRLSDRVTVTDGEITFDGVAVDDTLSRQILDAVQEGATETTYSGLVAFMEKVHANPDPATATRIYDWFKAQDGMTITPEGNIVGYKRVRKDNTHGYRSTRAGQEPVSVRFADGSEEVFTGYIPNPVGATVEMPRNLVNSNANQTCSVGLHVGAWSYMGSFGGDTTLEVHVDPRFVVSVPSDYQGAKVRVSRYTVVGPVTEKYGQAVKQSAEDAPRERGTADQATPTTAEDLDLALAPLRSPAPTFERELFEVGAVHEMTEDYNYAKGSKAGDRVTITEPLDAVSTLVGVRNHRNGWEGRLFAHRLSEKPSAYKAGDRVVFTEDYSEGFTVGTEATVVSVSSYQTPGSQTLLGLRKDDGGAATAYARRVKPVEPSNDTYAEGDRVIDNEGDEGTVQADLTVLYDNPDYSSHIEARDPLFEFRVTDSSGRVHGKGGATSQTAKGNGRNPAQDPSTGKFVGGRPGSQRGSNGRFV